MAQGASAGGFAQVGADGTAASRGCTRGRRGIDRAALTAVVIAYRAKSAFRDVGKALSFEPSQLDALSNNLMWWDGSDAMQQRVAETGLSPDDLAVKQLLTLTGELIVSVQADHLEGRVGE